MKTGHKLALAAVLALALAIVVLMLAAKLDGKTACQKCPPTGILATFPLSHIHLASGKSAGLSVSGDFTRGMSYARRCIFPELNVKYPLRDSSPATVGMR